MTTDTKTLNAQREYVKNLDEAGVDFSVVVPGAFVRGIRDLGYKDNAKALAELVDNSWEAGAKRADVIYGFTGKKSDAKPSEIAVLDDGCGMEPAMLRHAVRWGGTHREGSTSGLGKYGFGLPASCVSIGRRFTVYSKIEGGDVHSVSVDLDDIEKSGTGYRIPDAQPASLPKFVVDAMDEREWLSGTVVVIDKLDRLQRTTAKGLTEGLLLNHFGVTYHKLRRNFDIYVDGKFVEPLDPLFLTPGARLYDIDADRAKALEPLVLDVVNQETRKKEGRVTVRFAYFPPHFHLKDKTNESTSKGNRNARWHIMEDYNGIIVSRMGRVIDVVSSNTPLGRFVNYDRFIGIEIEFDASLDSDFGVTTSKQQIVISDRIWENLTNHGLKKIQTSLRNHAKSWRKDWEKITQDKEAGGSKTSARIMEETKKVVREPSAQVRERQKKRGEENAKKLASTRAAETGRSVEEEYHDIVMEKDGRLFDVEFENHPGAPFFRMDVLGGASVLYLNKGHRFFSELYMGPESSSRLRSAIELLLFCIGDSIVDASEEAQRLYLVEVPTWSAKLDAALHQLATEASIAGDDDEPATEESADSDLDDSEEDSDAVAAE
jgi:hypothetical protein